MSKKNYPQTGFEVAVIGMAVRFPQAETLSDFWQNLIAAKNCITYFSHQEMLDAGVEESLLNNAKYVKAKGMIHDGMGFDASLFSYSHREAELMDPQLRIYHECIFQALNNANYAVEDLNEQIGLYGGAGSNPQWTAQYLLDSSKSLAGQYEIGNLNGQEFFNTRVANKLNLKGPAITVQTACSSSLVAIHLAVQGLIAGDCELAVAGGVEMNTDPFLKSPDARGYLFQEGMINSPDGHCRPFDARANGTVSGDGAGAVVLKKLEDAIEDGDHIYAVIKGSAINNDGQEKTAYTAPSIKGQVRAISAAQEMAEVTPDSISYIEAHGTGTALGDPIEISALNQVFGSQKNVCKVGSVKSNIGHLGSAAGVAGFIKTVLSMYHNKLPASLHFESANPEIDFENTSFKVNSELSEWQHQDYPVRAGVSSFGIGGTNAHIILEEYIKEPAVQAVNDLMEQQGPVLLTLSSSTEEALLKQTENLGEYVNNNPSVNIKDIEYSLHVGRRPLMRRLAIVANNKSEAVEALNSLESPHRLMGTEKNNKIVFMFPGQGAQYVNMATQLYHAQKVYRSHVDECFALIEPEFSRQLQNILFDRDHQKNDQINNTLYTQPLLFIIEYALARYLMHLGVKPWAMIGHSLGEYVAATLSGVFDLPVALKVIRKRAELMNSTEQGSMLSVLMDEKQLMPLLSDQLDIAAVNGHDSCVVSGKNDAIEAFKQHCHQHDIKCQPLDTSHAYHSSLMQPIVNAFERYLSEQPINVPEVPYVSNTSGQWIQTSEAQKPSYWAQHLRNAVRFADGLNTLMKEDNALFIEVGPSKTLASFVRQHNQANAHHRIINVLPSKKEQVDDHMVFLKSLARMYVFGVNVDWHNYHSQPAQRVPLVEHVFNRTTYLPKATHKKSSSAVQRQHDFDQEKVFLQVPHWQKDLQVKLNHIDEDSIQEELQQKWLVFSDDSRCCKGIIDQLTGLGKQVVIVTIGGKYARHNANEYSIEAARSHDYMALFKDLMRVQLLPHHILHCWTAEWSQNSNDKASQAMDCGFYSLFFLAQAIGQLGIKQDIDIDVLSTDIHPVTGHEHIKPEKSTVLGAIRVINQEYSNLNCRNIDLSSTHYHHRKNIKSLINECLSKKREQFVAYRDHKRWLRRFDVVENQGLSSEQSNQQLKKCLRPSGHYLMTGGLGGIALTLALTLAQEQKLIFSLMSRSPFPDQDQWDEWLDKNPEENTISKKIKTLQVIQQLGSEVFVVQGDIADRQQAMTAMSNAEKHYGEINGVIHAAGVPSGRAIQLKSQAQCEEVFSAKVDGTKILKQYFADKSLDFVCLCSSITSFLGGFGQIDYCAANAFLDACVTSDYFDNVEHVFSINWDAWKEVGMAFNALNAELTGTIIHPLLGTVTNESEHKSGFKARFSADDLWTLNEHKVMGIPTLPGTSYIEMARAAMQQMHKIPANETLKVQFDKVYFLAPMIVDFGQWAEVNTTLVKKNNVYEFSVTSQLFGTGEVIKHASAELSLSQPIDVKDENILAQITADCSEQQINNMDDLLNAEENADKAIECGDHWQVFSQINVGKNQGLARLSLPAEFKEETEHLGIHPALMDCATAFLSPFIKQDFYLPLFYKRIKYLRPLTAECYSHSRLVQEDEQQKGVLNFDINIYDNAGYLLMSIEGFSMRQASGLPQQKTANQDNESQTILAPKVVDGLTNEQAVAAFKKIIISDYQSVVVTKKDMNHEVLHTQDLNVAENDQEPGQRVMQSRPELVNAYVPAKTETEKKLAVIWQNMLSIDKVGVLDDFFELQGDSLMLMQVHAQITEQFDKNIAIADLYNYPTIKALAASIDRQDTDNASELNQAEKRAARMKKAMRRRVKRVNI